MALSTVQDPNSDEVTKYVQVVIIIVIVNPIVIVIIILLNNCQILMKSPNLSLSTAAAVSSAKIVSTGCQRGLLTAASAEYFLQMRCVAYY